MMNVPFTILVVDDEPDFELLMRKKFRRKLKNNQLHLLFARNGIEALKILDTIKDIELILTDINMPQMDGLSFLRELKKRHYLSKAIVISAYGDMPNIRAAMNEGAFDFITKPIDFDDLDTTIQKGLDELKLLKQGIKAQQRLHIEEQKRITAEASQQFKEQFLAQMSHEIRTPMNAVMGMAQILLEKNPRSDQLDYLNAIQRSSENLLVILNDILDLSKIEAGKMELEQVPFKLKQVIQNLYNTLFLKVQQKKLILHIQQQPNLPEWLIGDPTRLFQILVNLLDNAIKFTKKGSVTLSIEHQQKISKQPKEIHLQFVVRDTGIGIAVEKLSTIFDDFSQAHQGINRKYGGTGLGLSIVKKLVQLQNGDISVTSALNEGTAFYINLPFLESENVSHSTTSTDTIEIITQKLNNIRVLLVEDNLLNQTVTVDTLQLYLKNVHIDVAENGIEAIQKINANHHAFYDIILMDIQMPKMNGYELTQYLRKLEHPIRQVPILALTANAIPSEINRCLEVGMNDYITKPFILKELLYKIYYLLQNDHTTAPDVLVAPLLATTVTNLTRYPNGEKQNLVVDLQFLEQFTKGNKGKINKYIELFLKLAPQHLTALQQHLAEENWKALRSNAHTLKSQFQYMGIHVLSPVISNIEYYAKEKTALDELPALVQQVVEVCEKAFVELQARLEN